MKYDIIGLSETRREGERLTRRLNGNIWHFFGETKGFRGVGFYINKNIADEIIEIKAYNERIAVAKIKISENINLAIFQVYSPTLGSDSKTPLSRNFTRNRNKKTQSLWGILMLR